MPFVTNLSPLFPREKGRGEVLVTACLLWERGGGEVVPQAAGTGPIQYGCGQPAVVWRRWRAFPMYQRMAPANSAWLQVSGETESGAPV